MAKHPSTSLSCFSLREELLESLKSTLRERCYTYASAAVCHTLILPQRAVLWTAAFSNEMAWLPASSPSWWHRWGHAEEALYPHQPTQVSCRLVITGNFSTAGSGEACQGQLQIVCNLV